MKTKLIDAPPLDAINRASAREKPSPSEHAAPLLAGGTGCARAVADVESEPLLDAL